MTISTYYGVLPQNVIVDNFGIGANVSQEIALATVQRVRAINVGDRADDSDRFTNKRSECYWRLREWLIKGGQLVKNVGWNQLFTIYYKRNLSGKIQIMSKEEMSKHGWSSPDNADALSLTFFGGETSTGQPIKSVEELSQHDLVKIAKIY